MSSYTEQEIIVSAWIIEHPQTEKTMNQVY